MIHEMAVLFMYAFWVIKSIMDLTNKFDNTLMEILIVAYIAVMFIVLFCKKNYHLRLELKGIGAIFLSIGALYLLSFSRNVTVNALRVVIVYVSSICLYFYFSNAMTPDKNSRFISFAWKVTFVCFLINLLYCISGNGMQMWGNIDTLSGLFYYKTDMATFIMQFMIYTATVFMMEKSAQGNVQVKNKICYIIFFISGTALIVLTDARIYLLVLAVFWVLFLVFYYGKKSVKEILSIRFLVPIGVLGLGLLAVANKIIGIVFSGREFLTIDFSNFFSKSNTQGRIVVWEGITNFMLHDATIFQKIFGVDLVSSSLTNSAALRAHSFYFYVWYSFGIAGLVLFAALIFVLLMKIRNCKNRNTAFLALMGLVQFLITGISQEVIDVSQQMFVLFMVMGMVEAESTNRQVST